MNQVLTGALQPYSRPMDQHIVQAKELKETALLNKMDVQMLARIRQSVEDDGIYKLYQICTAPFSNSRSILFHPVLYIKVGSLDIDAQEQTYSCMRKGEAKNSYWS